MDTDSEMKRALTSFLRNFLTCGLTGWCMEIIFTALDALRHRDMTLKGITSLWMFPIYGSAALLTPVAKLLKNRPAWLRGTAYMGLIYSVEYTAGRLLSRHGFCPWDYSRDRYRINNVTRLDFAPFWFGAGLLFEHLISMPPTAAGKNNRKTPSGSGGV